MLDDDYTEYYAEDFEELNEGYSECPEIERLKRRREEIRFSNTPVPRGSLIRNVVCTKDGDHVVFHWEVKSSYNTCLVLRSGTGRIECEFSKEALEPIVWKNAGEYIHG